MPDDERGTLPRRTLSDTRELRALAHPLRVRLLEELFLDGPLTATQLSDRLGESPANCSWHLRQLARYGYVEEAGGGTGRQRPWRAVMETHSWGDQGDSDAAVAGRAMADMMHERAYDQHRAYIARAQSEPEDWFHAAFFTQSLGYLTVDELREIEAKIFDLLMARADRFTDPSARPADARPVRFVAWCVPARPWSVDHPVPAPPDPEHAERPGRGPASRPDPRSEGRS